VVRDAGPGDNMTVRQDIFLGMEESFEQGYGAFNQSGEDGYAQHTTQDLGLGDVVIF
jgi:hypothetical protein